MQLTAVLVPDENGGFTATNPETGSTTQGETVEEALGNLQGQLNCTWKNFRISIAARRY